MTWVVPVSMIALWLLITAFPLTDIPPNEPCQYPYIVIVKAQPKT